MSEEMDEDCREGWWERVAQCVLTSSLSLSGGAWLRGAPPRGPRLCASPLSLALSCDQVVADVAVATCREVASRPGWNHGRRQPASKAGPTWYPSLLSPSPLSLACAIYCSWLFSWGSTGMLESALSCYAKFKDICFNTMAQQSVLTFATEFCYWYIMCIMWNFWNFVNTVDTLLRS